MNIVVVSGSSRPENQSRKIAGWVAQKLRALGATAELIDLYSVKLPIDLNLDVATLDQEPQALKAWEQVRATVQGADGFVFVSPEWNGMTPPAMLNFILYASADETKPFAHKPIQLMGVSNGRGGDYPIAELRAYGMKNALGLYIPGHIAVRNCRDMFNAADPDPNNKDDAYMQKRTLHSLQVLLQYAQALKPMRGQTEVDLLAYPNGM